MSQEIAQFVLNALKPGVKPERPDFFDDVGAWRKIFDYSLRLHSILPLMVKIDRAEWRADLPVAVSLQIDERLQRERMILAILDDELDSALFLLVSAKIPVIVLKGMDLGRRYYPERVMRPMADVDLLVPPEAFTESLRVLARGDYRIVGPFPEGRFRVELARRENAPTVELHKYILAGDTDLSIAGIWKRSVEGVLRGLPHHARALSVEDNLIYLVRHCAVQHLLESPIWLNDIHYLIESEDFRQKADWDRIVWSLAQSRALSGAYLVLHLLRADWGTSIPEEAMKGVDRKVGAFRRVLLDRLASASAWFPGEGRRLPWVMKSRFLLRDSAWDALVYGIQRERLKRQPSP